MPVGPSPGRLHQSNPNRLQYPPATPSLSTIFYAAKHCRRRRPISLTSRSLSRAILASAEGKSSIHRHAFSRFELEVSLKLK